VNISSSDSPHFPSYRAHPWHGVDPLIHHPSQHPCYVRVYVEMTPQSDVKLELDKDTGLLTVDRPQKYTNMLPCLYGFVPRSYCDHHVAEHTRKALYESGHNKAADGCVGDGDPLDICVFTDRHFQASDVLVEAKVIGGLRMLDGGKADDKILAVLRNDTVYGDMDDIADLPLKCLDKIQHYFLTYKDLPATAESSSSSPSVPRKITPRKITIIHSYNAKEASTIVSLACKDYQAHYSYK